MDVNFFSFFLTQGPSNTHFWSRYWKICRHENLHIWRLTHVKRFFASLRVHVFARVTRNYAFARVTRNYAFASFAFFRVWCIFMDVNFFSFFLTQVPSGTHFWSHFLKICRHENLHIWRLTHVKPVFASLRVHVFARVTRNYAFARLHVRVFRARDAFYAFYVFDAFSWVSLFFHFFWPRGLLVHISEATFEKYADMKICVFDAWRTLNASSRLYAFTSSRV